MAAESVDKVHRRHLGVAPIDSAGT